MSEAHAAVDDVTIERIVSFHGHMCPGLAMGVLAARIALEEIGPHAVDEEVVAVTETDMCAVDAVQYLTGCTYGKGNLIHEDWGKHAFTFFRRSDGRAIRLAARGDAVPRDPAEQELFAKIRAGEADDLEKQRFLEARHTRSRQLLAMDPEDLYSVERFMGVPPPKARIHASVRCAACDEEVMETRVRRFDGRELCQPCFEEAAESRPRPGRIRPNLLELGS